MRCRYSVQEAQAWGIRCVFQELSLCPNLTVAENTRIRHPSLKGPGWRRRAANPDRCGARSHLPRPPHPRLGSRRRPHLGAASDGRDRLDLRRLDRPSDLIILDEPTSSLDQVVARQLLDHVRRMTAEGCSVILISHILGEILTTADRIVVMKDGGVVEAKPARTTHERASSPPWAPSFTTPRAQRAVRRSRPHAMTRTGQDGAERPGGRRGEPAASAQRAQHRRPQRRDHRARRSSPATARRRCWC